MRWGCLGLVVSIGCTGYLNGQVEHPSSESASIPATAPTPAHRAETTSVTYSGGMLTVTAANGSLNQILREIARQTGMKISGGVVDDRVFGSYGPASPSAILATLLDGTDSNMLLVQNAAHRPTELVLTPRLGGVTPPNPNASRSGEDAQESLAEPPPPEATPQGLPGGSSRSPNRVGTGGVAVNPAATEPSSTSQELVFPQVDPTTPASTATTTPNSPDPSSDTVRTPQQIFEQLQRMRQQQPNPQ